MAHLLTGLPKEFLSSLKRGQVSDLITSARALLLPVETIKLGESEKGQGGAGVLGRESGVGLEGGQDWHRWQFQLR